jgi:hypothetical protein
MKPIPDPFRKARQEAGILECPFQGESVPMILRHEAVRRAAKDWMIFSSDAPFRVPIPSEEDVRTMRQLPIETNPPEHTEYRAIVEPFFRRPKDPEFVARIESLIETMLADAIEGGPVEVVRGFALPLQSRAMTYLLNVPETEADIWIGWGIHVFHDGGSGENRGSALEDYLHSQWVRYPEACLGFWVRASQHGGFLHVLEWHLPRNGFQGSSMAGLPTTRRGELRFAQLIRRGRTVTCSLARRFGDRRSLKCPHVDEWEGRDELRHFHMRHLELVLLFQMPRGLPRGSLLEIRRGRRQPRRRFFQRPHPRDVPRSSAYPRGNDGICKPGIRRRA